ncbi:MAG TPA: indole-3-glycerol-phosphate synthase [Actinomycetota bacterium]|nr:indole-3-glycerol-phosphate synthase [Actinomycetota bacterium]
MGFLTDLTSDLRDRFAADPPDLDALRAAAAAAPPARDLATALAATAGDGVLALIAEVKRASPSAGAIAPAADPARQAGAYVRAGASAVSVLTEAVHFGGSLDDLIAVRAAVDVPVLRKDFVVHEAQVLEARAAGADSLLLITACLDDRELAALLAASRSVGMEPLVETHDDRDVARALATDARIVGINARDLETLAVDVPASLARMRVVGDDRIVVAESGIRDHEDVRAAAAAGASAILVGETLMRAEDPGAVVRALLHGAGAQEAR